MQTVNAHIKSVLSSLDKAVQEADYAKKRLADVITNMDNVFLQGTLEEFEQYDASRKDTIGAINNAIGAIESEKQTIQRLRNLINFNASK